MPFIFHHEHKDASEKPVQYAAVLVPDFKFLRGNFVLFNSLKKNNYIAVYDPQKEKCMLSLLEAAKKKSCTEDDQIHLFYLIDSDKITISNPLNSTFLISLISNGEFVSEETTRYPFSRMEKQSFEELSKALQEQKHERPPLTRKTTLLITETLGLSPTTLKPKTKPETPVITSPTKMVTSPMEEPNQPMPDLSSLTISKGFR